jgi:hypothetical protein
VISEKTVDHEIGCDAGIITAGVEKLSPLRIVRAPPHGLGGACRTRQSREVLAGCRSAIAAEPVRAGPVVVLS